MSDDHDPAPSPHVRPATPADHDAIRQVVADAFGSDAETALVDRIRASAEYEPSMDLVAVDGNGRVVGHVMISRANLQSVSDRSIAMLSPLAVVPAQHRRGIGGALVRTSTEIADRRGEPLVVLEGSPRYYSRFGFVAASNHGITMPLPDWAPPEAAQVMLLSAYDRGDATLRGTVEYPAAFDGFD